MRGGPVRQLPLRVPLGTGEALDSWLLRLAHRNQVPAHWLLGVLGLTGRIRVWRNYTLVRGMPSGLLRRIEFQAGLAPDALDQAVLDRYEPLGWKPTVGSRYCVKCLAASSGQWPLAWQLPYTFACLRHRCLLVSVCPSCGGRPHSGLSPQAGLLPPHRCALRTGPRQDACGADLLTHRVARLSAGDPRLAAQNWINQRLDAASAGFSSDPHDLAILRDLDALSLWLRRRIEPGDVAHLGAPTITAITAYRDPRQRLPLRALQPTASLVTAAVAEHAVGLLTADDQTRYQRLAPFFRDVTAKRQPASRSRPAARFSASPPAPMILSHQRMARLSAPLQQALLVACDPHLAVSERLRYRTCTTSPRLAEPGSALAADRARHIPQYLWQDWIVRFCPPVGIHADTIGTDLAAALVLPGNPIRNRHATTELTGWTQNSTQTLRTLAEHHRDALTAICALADYLDTHGSPIDYRRRRATFADAPLMTWDEWIDLCGQAGAHPGKATRHLHARRHLFALLTGADLADPRHLPAFADAQQRERYNGFQHDLASPLRDALHRHAARILHNAGIDEPVTWTPPADCVAGLTLPGRDPDDIDLDALHRLIVVNNLAPTTAARQLNVSVEHIRYARRRLHRPTAAPVKNTPTAARKAREQAETVLTAEFLEREHIRGGKTLRSIAHENGFDRRLVSRQARRHGITTAGRRRHPALDPRRLREQTETQQLTAGQIAAAAGLTAETVRRALKDLGITGRPIGAAGHLIHTQRYPGLPDDIRHAVEGQRHGWRRLHRFQQMMTHHSMNVAATALGTHPSNLALQIQRLETDIGAQLLHRGHRYQPMTLTDRGQRLIEQLDQPEVRRLLNEHATTR